MGSTQMMNALKFMFFLALVVFVSATPVNEDDIVPETKLVNAAASSGSGSGSGTSSTTKGSSSTTKGSSSTTKSGKKCKSGTKEQWWTEKYQSSAPTGNNLAIKNRAINTCQTHCTTNLGGAKRCNGKIDEHNLSKSPSEVCHVRLQLSIQDCCHVIAWHCCGAPRQYHDLALN